MAPASGFGNEGEARGSGAGHPLSVSSLTRESKKSVSLLLSGARVGSLSLKKKASMVFVLHRLRKRD